MAEIRTKWWSPAHSICSPYLDQADINDRKLYSPFALEGATLYDGHKDGRVKMKLKGSQLRGIYNRCMLCSEKELESVMSTKAL